MRRGTGSVNYLQRSSLKTANKIKRKGEKLLAMGLSRKGRNDIIFYPFKGIDVPFASL